MIVSEKKYQKLLRVKKDYKRILKNSLQAFLFGGLICLFGQILVFIIGKWVYDEKLASTIMLIIILLISGLLTAFGLYDKVGQIAKAGSVVPIVGFENSLCCSAMEYRSEGLILGLGANVLKLAGSVIVFGIVSGYVVGLIKYLVFLWK